MVNQVSNAFLNWQHPWIFVTFRKLLLNLTVVVCSSFVVGVSTSHFWHHLSLTVRNHLSLFHYHLFFVGKNQRSVKVFRNSDFTARTFQAKNDGFCMQIFILVLDMESEKERERERDGRARKEREKSEKERKVRERERSLC